MSGWGVEKVARPSGLWSERVTSGARYVLVLFLRLSTGRFLVPAAEAGSFGAVRAVGWLEGGRHALVVEERHDDRVARGPLVESVGGRGERAVLGAQFAPRRVVPGRERRVYEVRLQESLLVSYWTLAS